MAITTKSSINVKPLRLGMWVSSVLDFPNEFIADTPSQYGFYDSKYVVWFDFNTSQA